MKTEAQRKARDKYNAKFDMVRFRVPQGNLDKIKARAAALGKSLNQYITDLIKADMQE